MQLTKPGIYMGYIAGDETPPMRETPHIRNINQSHSTWRRDRGDLRFS
jgi:hypothetical protein